jgi:type I restriction enzyme S subunit
MAIEELIGPAPPRWEYKTLGAACDDGGGDIQTGPFGSQLHARDYVPIGIPSIMPQNIGDNRIVEDGWLCGTGCLRVRVGERGDDPRFVSYYLGHPDVREWVVRHAHGATMPNLNTSILAACPFLKPPLPEQRAIATAAGSSAPSRPPRA